MKMDHLRLAAIYWTRNVKIRFAGQPTSHVNTSKPTMGNKNNNAINIIGPYGRNLRSVSCPLGGRKYSATFSPSNGKMGIKLKKRRMRLIKINSSSKKDKLGNKVPIGA